jgi:hypothetical protein
MYNKDGVHTGKACHMHCWCTQSDTHTAGHTCSHVCLNIFCSKLPHFLIINAPCSLLCTACLHVHCCCGCALACVKAYSTQHMCCCCTHTQLEKHNCTFHCMCLTLNFPRCWCSILHAACCALHGCICIVCCVGVSMCMHMQACSKLWCSTTVHFMLVYKPFVCCACMHTVNLSICNDLRFGSWLMTWCC